MASTKQQEIVVTPRAAVSPTIAKSQLEVLEALTLLQRLPDLDSLPGPRMMANASARVLPIDELAHTDDHHACPACKALDAALQVERKNISSLTFNEGRLYWMARRAQATGLKDGTHERDDAYMEALSHFFGPMRFRDITPGHLRAYQIAREKNSVRTAGGDVKPWKRRAANSTINHELALLGRMLTHCRLWKNLKDYYFPRPVDKWSPRQIMEEKDEAEFFAKGATDPQARLAYLVALLTNNTTASGSELRYVQLKHIFLRPGGEISEIYIPPEGCKNEVRPRKIALNRTAKWAVGQLYARALGLGSANPDDFLFPFWLKRNQYDATRPASKTFLRKSWARLRLITGQPQLCPHDLRHHCVTRMLEEGVDPETVRSIAGHLRPEMTEYYSHQRKGVKYKALQKIDPAMKKPPQIQKSPVARRDLL